MPAATTVYPVRPTTQEASGLEAIGLLYGMEVPVVADLEVYERAARLAVDTGQHVFDTLYHALALTRDVFLVTADERYYRAARRAGRLVRLADVT